MRPKRAMWVMYHSTLHSVEVPSIESLGFEVYVPSPRISSEPMNLTLDPNSVEILDRHDFYNEPWSEELKTIINREFDFIVTSVYHVPLNEQLQHFKGPVFGRVFGREEEFNYAHWFEHYGSTDFIKQAGERFVFAAAYHNILKIEERYLTDRASVIYCGIPNHILNMKDTWKRSKDVLMFHCPRISTVNYYRQRYEIIRANFEGVPRVIMGSGSEPTEDDPTILGTISNDALFDLYQSVCAFLYTSPEARHLHYSPVEAVIIGAPVLYLRGSQLSELAGTRLPGECESIQDMRAKGESLLAGDIVLQEEIRSSQKEIFSDWDKASIRKQWEDAIGKVLHLFPS